MTTILEKAYNQNPWWMNEHSIEDDYQLKELQKNKLVFLNQDFPGIKPDTIMKSIGGIFLINKIQSIEKSHKK